MGGRHGGEEKPAITPSRRRPVFSPPAATFVAAPLEESPRLSASSTAKAADYRSLQSSPFSFRPSHSTQGTDYPVFTPTYEVASSPAALHIRSKSQPSFEKLAAAEDDVIFGWEKRVSSSHAKKDETRPAVKNPLIDRDNSLEPPRAPLQVFRNQRGVLAWMFPKFRRKPKPTTQEENQSSLMDLRQKLRHLEAHSEELKKDLAAANQRDTHNPKTRIDKSPLPVNHDVMVEGFLQIVLEARLSVKRLSMSLASQTDETTDLPYHLQALVNRSLYEDFENCVFERNGSPRQLDPRLDRRENFSAFVSLRNLSWRDLFSGGGSQPLLAELSRFCERKMACMGVLLERAGSRGEATREAFFVAAKCVWLVHLLAFSFSPPLTIMRVGERRRFDAMFMEDVVSDRGVVRQAGRIQVMVAPGFYLRDSVVRCRVLCSDGSVV